MAASSTAHAEALYPRLNVQQRLDKRRQDSLISCSGSPRLRWNPELVRRVTWLLTRT